jgi:hypothetical protein
MELPWTDPWRRGAPLARGRHRRPRQTAWNRLGRFLSLGGGNTWR